MSGLSDNGPSATLPTWTGSSPRWNRRAAKASLSRIRQGITIPAAAPHVLKVKNFRDMEGLVIGINKGKGKYKDAMGSLLLRLDNGVRI